MKKLLVLLLVLFPVTAFAIDIPGITTQTGTFSTRIKFNCVDEHRGPWAKSTPLEGDIAVVRQGNVIEKILLVTDWIEMLFDKVIAVAISKKGTKTGIAIGANDYYQYLDFKLTDRGLSGKLGVGGEDCVGRANLNVIFSD
jgi:hypothetical protein